MPLPIASTKPAIASLSLGRAYAGHSLEAKLAAARLAGFQGIECFYEDLEWRARDIALAERGTSTTTPTTTTTSSSSSDHPYAEVIDDRHLLAAAQDFRDLADQNGLEVMVLQPFMHYEGLLCLSERVARLRKLELWLKLAKVLAVEVIQVPSNFLAGDETTTGQADRLVEDFRVLADRGAREEPVVRFAYEGLCWGRWVDEWRGAWEVVRRVGRGNFGLCLDTFHLAGREWADPGVVGGVVEGGDGMGGLERFEASMREMARTVDVAKVFYVQVADARRPEKPITPGSGQWVDGQPARMTWSRRMRVFLGEEDGYLPIHPVLKAVLAPAPEGLGYKGWVSMEIFNRSLEETDAQVVPLHADRARKSWLAIKSSIDSYQST